MSATLDHPPIDTTALRYGVGQRTILDIDAIRIEHGQFVLLAGDNGSGKTTLLKIMSGLLTASHGEFACDGARLQPAAAARFYRGRHIYLHQTAYLFDTTVAGNIAYGLRIRGLDRRRRQIEMRECLAWGALEDLADRHARELSTGEQQRVALARARVLAPTVLLVDEITANMDQANRLRCLQMIAELTRNGSSVVFASHDPAVLSAPHDAVITLAEGRRVAAALGDGADVIPLTRGALRPGGR